MPNWCTNHVTLYGDTQEIENFLKHITLGITWFSYWIPAPKEDTGNGNYATWGCREDTVATDWRVNPVSSTVSSISFSFVSPWAPPIKLYEHLFMERGIAVDAEYYEGGMEIFGKFNRDGTHTHYATRDDVPQELIDEWGITRDTKTSLERENENLRVELALQYQDYEELALAGDEIEKDNEKIVNSLEQDLQMARIMYCEMAEYNGHLLLGVCMPKEKIAEELGWNCYEIKSL